MTRIIHGQDAVDRAERASSLLFGDRITELTVDEVLAVFDDVPSTEVEAARFAGEGVAITELMVLTGLVRVEGRSDAARSRAAG